ncbi:hypothetical protein [Boudabousia liubingyangii]|nr:hypothetical protein [Boudabousia liubingyangii]
MDAQDTKPRSLWNRFIDNPILRAWFKVSKYLSALVGYLLTWGLLWLWSTGMTEYRSYLARTTSYVMHGFMDPEPDVWYAIQFLGDLVILVIVGPLIAVLLMGRQQWRTIKSGQFLINVLLMLAPVVLFFLAESFSKDGFLRTGFFIIGVWLIWFVIPWLVAYLFFSAIFAFLDHRDDPSVKVEFSLGSSIDMD